MPHAIPVRVAAASWVGLAAATLSFAASPATAQDDPPATTWGVAPAGPAGPDGRAAFDYKLDPGAELVDQLAVSNHSTEALSVRVYASDAFTTAEGGFDLLPAAEPAVEVGTWITLDSPELTVPARSRVLVPFQLAVPANATPGDHAGGLVAAVSSLATDQDGGQVQVEHRVGARIYLRITGALRPELTIERLAAGYEGSWHPFRAGALTTTYTIRNTGNVRLAAEPELVVTGPFGIGRRAAVGDRLPEILPGGAVTVTVRADGVPPLIRLTGVGTVRPDPVDGQALEPQPPRAERVTRVWAIPWSQGLLLALAIGAAVGWWRLRRRRRKWLTAQLAAARAQGRAEAQRGAQLVGERES